MTQSYTTIDFRTNTLLWRIEAPIKNHYQKSLYLNSYLRNSNATAPRAASSDVKYKLKFSSSQSVLQGEDDDGDDDVLNDKNRTEKCMHKFISL